MTYFSQSGTKPAWSQQFAPDTLKQLSPALPSEAITPEWACGDSTGKGVKVAVFDSGIEASHPAVGGKVRGFVRVSEGSNGPLYDTTAHEDLYGHGTACAGVIHSIAPDCELYSVQVLGRALSGRGAVLIAALRWALDNDMRV